MTYADLQVERDGSTGRISIDLAPMNVMSRDTIEELDAAVQDLDGDDELKSLVIESEGDAAFSAGVEVEDHLGDALPEMIELFGSLFETIRGADTPVIAAVDGRALGGGCELAVGCDLAVATEDAVFAQPEINLGTFPPIAAAMFPDAVSQKAAFELIVGGDEIGAERARDLGLVNRVVEEDELAGAVEELTDSFAHKSGLVVGMAKEAFYDVSDRASFAESLSVANEHAIEMTETEDGQEGLTAFMEDRRPEWNH